MKLLQIFAMVLGLGTSVTVPVLVGGAVMTTIIAVEPAQACDSACETAKWQATRKPFTGHTAPKFVDTCVRLLASDARAADTEVVLVAGSDPVNGRVITSLARGAGYSFKLPNQPQGTEDVYVREFCFPGKLIQGLSAITFCNGLSPQDGNHHTLSLSDDSAIYLRRLQQTGQAGDFLTLLGTKRTYKAPVATFFTEDLYRRLFG